MGKTWTKSDLQVDGEALNCEAGLKTERVKFLCDRQKALRDTTNNTTSEHSWAEIAALQGTPLRNVREKVWLSWVFFFFPSSSSFTVWTLTTTAIDSLPHSPWFRWCTSSLSAAVTCKCLAWAKWINKQYRNVLSTGKLPFSQSRSLCVIKKIAYMYIHLQSKVWTQFSWMFYSLSLRLPALQVHTRDIKYLRKIYGVI